jgi:two-component system OmpR family sensor kinase
MDGLKRKIAQTIRQSLQIRLFLGLSAAIIGFAVIAGITSFVSVFSEANEMQDAQLRELAHLISRYHLPVAQIQAMQETAHQHGDSRFVIQELPSRDSAPADPEREALAVHHDMPDGIQNIISHGDMWRIFVSTPASGPRFAIGQKTDARNDIAQASALSTILPFAILIPTLLILINIAIRRMFAPVRRLAAEVNVRTEHNLQPLDSRGIPSEVLPFVDAINRLLTRAGESLAQQRRFVADAAHELRSPLTALSLQAELLDGASMSERARERLATLRKGLERARALLGQMLSLARAQEPDSASAGRVSVQQVFRDVLEGTMPLADRKHIDIGVTSDVDATVLASEKDLKSLVRNLVENAVRYTPEQGRVDLSTRVDAMHVYLEIEDSGPGIPHSERARVFDPFYRIPGSADEGSGLGLSIVKTIADRYQATVTLGARADAGQGLRVTVAFPRTA